MLTPLALLLRFRAHYQEHARCVPWMVLFGSRTPSRSVCRRPRPCDRRRAPQGDRPAFPTPPFAPAGARTCCRCRQRRSACQTRGSRPSRSRRAPMPSSAMMVTAVRRRSWSRHAGKTVPEPSFSLIVLSSCFLILLKPDTGVRLLVVNTYGHSALVSSPSSPGSLLRLAMTSRDQRGQGDDVGAAVLGSLARDRPRRVVVAQLRPRHAGHLVAASTREEQQL